MNEIDFADFVNSSNHPYQCRCDKCLKWWIAVGPEEGNNDTWIWGPFTEHEIRAAGGRIPKLSPSQEHQQYLDQEEA